MDAAVKISKVEHVNSLDPATLAPRPLVRVTYMVGEQGPFFLVTPASEFNQEYVDRETAKMADTLKGLGVVK